MSVFDFVGSFAMAFTTLPTPSTDYIYGGRGNEKTCTAQGFLIQMGTIGEAFQHAIVLSMAPKLNFASHDSASLLPWCISGFVLQLDN
jgi:hypothetical protein